MSDLDTPIKYIVKEKSLIGNEVFEPGAEVTLPEGTLPAENLEPTCDRGRAKYQEYLESNAARVAKMKADFGEETNKLGDASVLGKLIAAAVATALKEQREADEAQAAALAEAQAKPEAKRRSAEAPAPDSLA